MYRVRLISGVSCKVSRDRNQSSFPRVSIGRAPARQQRRSSEGPRGRGLGGIRQWQSNHGVNKLPIIYECILSFLLSLFLADLIIYSIRIIIYFVLILLYNLIIFHNFHVNSKSHIILN